MGRYPTGAGEGDRTLVVSLENFCSTIELHPQLSDQTTQYKPSNQSLEQLKSWWRGKDSNLRRQSRQIYSLIPLTAREPLQAQPTIMPISDYPVKQIPTKKCKTCVFLRFFACGRTQSTIFSGTGLLCPKQSGLRVRLQTLTKGQSGSDRPQTFCPLPRNLNQAAALLKVIHTQG